MRKDEKRWEKIEKMRKDRKDEISLCVKETYYARRPPVLSSALPRLLSSSTATRLQLIIEPPLCNSRWKLSGPKKREKSCTKKKKKQKVVHDWKNWSTFLFTDLFFVDRSIFFDRSICSPMIAHLSFPGNDCYLENRWEWSYFFSSHMPIFGPKYYGDQESRRFQPFRTTCVKSVIV